MANKNKNEQQRTVLVEQEARGGKKGRSRSRQDNRAVVKDAQEKVAELEKQTADIVRTSRQKDAELAKLKRDHPDNFCGEISFVDLRDHTVWIDCGAADGLGRQVTFSVYSGDATDLAKATVKAKIEVTKVNEHMSMARIVDDQVTDLVPGDKIFTPMWSPGERKHFALVGFLDLNDDGKDDHEGVKNLIKLHHGVIDCDVDDKGKINGTIAIHTNYLICGEPPGKRDGRTWQSLHHARRTGRRVGCPEDFARRVEGPDGLPEPNAGEELRPPPGRRLGQRVDRRFGP